jgi:hypothetical protein
MPSSPSLISQDRIEKSVLFLRGEKVLLDSDLAEFYGVTTKALNQAVKRNSDRFPADFMFRLSAQEVDELNRSQIVTGSRRHRNPRFPPFAFTEQGVAMLSSVVRSKRAVQANIQIMRAFVRLRQILAVNADLARRLTEVEAKLGQHDEQFISVIRAIRELMQPNATSVSPRRKIGFYQTNDPSREGRDPKGRRRSS